MDMVQRPPVDSPAERCRRELLIGVRLPPLRIKRAQARDSAIAGSHPGRTLSSQINNAHLQDTFKREEPAFGEGL